MHASACVAPCTPGVARSAVPLRRTTRAAHLLVPSIHSIVGCALGRIAGELIDRAVDHFVDGLFNFLADPASDDSPTDPRVPSSTCSSNNPYGLLVTLRAGGIAAVLQIAWLNAVRETLSDIVVDSTLRARLLTEGSGSAVEVVGLLRKLFRLDHTLGSGLYNPRAPRVPGARVALTIARGACRRCVRASVHICAQRPSSSTYVLDYVHLVRASPREAHLPRL